MAQLCNLSVIIRPTRIKLRCHYLTQNLCSSLKHQLRKEIYKCRSLVMSQSSHLERTKDVQRQQDITSASVKLIHNESKTVKKITLAIENMAFSFKPGQWVDFFIPGVNTVGGFSICSAPKQLNDNREIELAVKYSTHPPAYWVHTKGKEGDKVLLRVGGKFYYDPSASASRKNLLLIAGGVGINPLYSILQHMYNFNAGSLADGANLFRTALLYSAKSTEELLFKNNIDEMIAKDDTLSCSYHVTGRTPQILTPSNCKFLLHRIDSSSIKAALTALGNQENILCYICGPPPMIEDMNELLLANGMPETCIHFEKWW